MVKTNIISSFIFIQDHKVNMEKKIIIFRCISQPLFFSNPEKTRFRALPARKSTQGSWQKHSQDIHNAPLPSPSPLDTQLSHDKNTGLCPFVGWDVQAVPGQGCSRQPRVLAVWSHDSSVPGSAAEEQPRDPAGREWARNSTDCSGCCPPLASSTFFLNYKHFWWLKMETQKSCPDFCLY